MYYQFCCNIKVYMVQMCYIGAPHAHHTPPHHTSRGRAMGPRCDPTYSFPTYSTYEPSGFTNAKE
jgi:hypothetical protein